MSDQEKKTPSAAAPVGESQQQRWIKYGSNVLLTIVIVVLLAGFLIYIGGQKKKRIDFTADRVYSLKPQTQNILKNLDQPIEIYSLYPKPDNDTQQDFYHPMLDLLDEYHRSSKNVQIEEFDPDKEPGKLKDLIERVSKKYSGEIKQYSDALKQFATVREQLIQFATEEAKTQRSIKPRSVSSTELAQAMRDSQRLAQSLKSSLQSTQDSIDARLQGQLPDYKLAAEDAETAMGAIQPIFQEVVDNFTKLKDQSDIPDDLRAYMADALPRFTANKKLVDDVLESLKKRGDIKLDALLQGVRREALLVMGRDDVKVLPFERIWKADPHNMMNSGSKPKLRFAGEQQISGAIAQLETTKKPKVVFVRAGGPPMASPEFGDSAMYAILADRLREYNYDVQEKDLTNMWQMQARQAQQPIPPEPTDAEIADAVWIVVDRAAPQMQFAPPATIVDKVAEHLQNGGSALVLVDSGGEDMHMALAEWGVSVKPNQMLVHELVKSNEASNNFVDQLLMQQPIFPVHEYGDSQITQPIQSLEGLLVGVPVSLELAKGYHGSPILPVPRNLPSWAEHEHEGGLESLMSGAEVKFDAAQGDIANTSQNPLYAGAVVEKDNGGGRLVVIGSVLMATDGALSYPDLDILASTGQRVSQFPGNLELFTNSIFWLSKNETMIAISPSAMEVTRIKPIGPAFLSFWRIGVLIIGLPLLVIAGGITTYLARRD